MARRALNPRPAVGGGCKGLSKIGPGIGARLPLLFFHDAVPSLAVWIDRLPDALNSVEREENGMQGRRQETADLPGISRKSLHNRMA